MSLAGRCAYAFSRAVQSRGQDYFDQGRVERAVADGNRIHARVRGGDVYELVIEADPGGTLLLDCGCKAADTAPCKHMWAVLLHIDIAWPQLEPPGTDRLTVKLWAPPGSGYDRKVLPAPRPGLSGARSPGWRGLVASVEPPEPGAAGPGAGAIAGWSPVEYQLDLERSRGRGGIAVRFFTRRSRTGGGIGPPVPARFADSDVDRAGSEDRPVLDLLLRASRPADDERWAVYRQYHGDLTTDAVEIHAGLVHLALERLCATGRFGWRDGVELRPLSWDAGPPWRFAIEMARAPAGDRRTVTGVLVRDGDTRRSTLPQGSQSEPGGGRRLLADALLAHVGGVVIFRDRIVSVDLPPGTGSWMIAARTGGDFELPRRDEAAFLRAACETAGATVLSIDPALGWKVAQGVPVPRIRFLVSGAAVRSSLGARVAFDYPGGSVDLDEGRSGFVDAEHRVLTLRDRIAERDALEGLWDAGMLRARADSPPRHADVAYGDFDAVVTRLLAAGWRAEAEGRAIRPAGAVHMGVSSGLDWFELAGAARFGDVELPLPALLAAVRRGDRFVELGDGSRGMLPEEWLARFGLLARAGRADAGGDALRFVRAQAGLLDALLAGEPEVDVDAGFAKARAQLRDFDGVRPAAPPRGFQGELRDYQREGLGWLGFLTEFGFGGCLADDMGLGKTIQVLALLESRRVRRGDKRPSLVVVPRSLVFNWRDEAARFTPKLKILEYVGPGRAALREQFADHDLVVTTYGTLRRDVDELSAIRFDHAILDEAQAIKNPDSQSARAVRRLRADHRLALTGTPVENRLGDLASIFEFLNPCMMGGSDALAALLDPEVGGEGLALLGRSLRPFILRRTKEQVLRELPARTEQVIHCQLDGPQRELYRELRDYYRASLARKVGADGLARAKIHVLEALLRLRQAACHPGLIDAGRAGEGSAKLDALIPLLAEVTEAGHKALVFSQFTTFLGIVRARLEAAGIVHEYLDGRTRDRRARVARFQTDPDCRVFLISLKAGGQGLNLTAADYVFLLDPWWNPAVEAQAIDRAHRIGQSRPVLAYRLIAEDTVEDKVLALQAGKRHLADAIMTRTTGPLAELTAAELEELLS